MAAKESSKDTEDYSKKSILYLGIIIICIIIIIAAIYFTTTYLNKKVASEKRVVYNNFVFDKLDDNTWSVNLSIKNTVYTIPFYYNPYEVENITIYPDTLPAIKRFMNESPNGRVFVAVDPYETSKVVIAGVEVTRILGKRYDIFNFNVIPAFTRRYESQNMTYPVVSCDNANSNNIVIILLVGNFTGIGYKDDCIALQADNVNDTIKVADAFSYRLLGIIR